MAKIKSVKFYNHKRIGTNGLVMYAVRFYDQYGKLVVLDFLNSPFTKGAIYSETAECIVTMSQNDTYQYYNCGAAFHTGNYNKSIGIDRFGIYNHISGDNPEDFYKIEFKIPQLFSDIQITHNAYCDGYPTYGFSECDYDIEYDNGIIETKTFVSNNNLPPIYNPVFGNNSYNQETLDAMFESIEFSKSKQIYDSEIGLIETLNTNNFKNIPVNSIEKLKVIYTKPVNTLISCLVSFDQKQTWKTFNGNNWIEISDTSANNVILNCMDIEVLNSLDKNKLISGGFVGDLDFKIAIKTNDENNTPSVSKIYIEYK